ncbi:MAG TPA: hypothetical protein VHM26_10650, partial [Chitinophagaceae bacterium]|nr:hypothetical protein [Chitinophagaceae bacterium]
CDNMMWKSMLGRIDNDSLIEIGKMEANGCDNNPKFDRMIRTYRIKGENTRLVDRIFYVRVITPLIDKWTFLEKYWKKNYSRFE